MARWACTDSATVKLFHVHRYNHTDGQLADSNGSFRKSTATTDRSTATVF